MPPLEKVKLITALNLLNSFKTVTSTNVSFLVSVAKIINIVGISIIDGINELPKPEIINSTNNPNNANLLLQMQNMLNECFPLLCFYLSHKEFSVALCLDDFAHAFVNHTKHSKDPEYSLEILTKLSTIIVQQIKYPLDYESEEGLIYFTI